MAAAASSDEHSPAAQAGRQYKSEHACWILPQLEKPASHSHVSTHSANDECRPQGDMVCSAGCVPTALRLRAAPLGDADAAAWKPGECPVCLDTVADSSCWLRFVCGHGTCRECLYSLAHSRYGAVLHVMQRHDAPMRPCGRAADVCHPVAVVYQLVWCSSNAVSIAGVWVHAALCAGCRWWRKRCRCPQVAAMMHLMPSVPPTAEVPHSGRCRLMQLRL